VKQVRARSWLLRFSLQPTRALSTPAVFRGFDNALAAVTGGEKSGRIGSETSKYGKKIKKREGSLVAQIHHIFSKRSLK